MGKVLYFPVDRAKGSWQADMMPADFDDVWSMDGLPSVDEGFHSALRAHIAGSTSVQPAVPLLIHSTYSAPTEAQIRCQSDTGIVDIVNDER